MCKLDKSPKEAVISLGINKVDLIVDFCMKNKFSIFNVYENNFNIDELLAFCKEKDVISVLVDMNKPYLVKMLEVIASNKEFNTTLVCIISEAFKESNHINHIGKSFHIIFTPEELENFHNPLKVIYSPLIKGFVGMDFGDTISFLEDTSYIKYMSEKNVTGKNLDLAISHITDKSQIIQDTFSTKIEVQLFAVVEGNNMFHILFLNECVEKLSRAIMEGKSFLINALVDEQRTSEDYDIHLLIGVK